jgi:hypothetical protein
LLATLPLQKLVTPTYVSTGAKMIGWLAKLASLVLLILLWLMYQKMP